MNAPPTASTIVERLLAALTWDKLPLWFLAGIGAVALNRIREAGDAAWPAGWSGVWAPMLLAITLTAGFVAGIVSIWMRRMEQRAAVVEGEMRRQAADAQEHKDQCLARERKLLDLLTEQSTKLRGLMCALDEQGIHTGPGDLPEGDG